jgi:NADPH-dependent curcumin reductase CurA
MLEIGEESEQVISAKFEDIPKIWVKLFEGGNMGKLVTKLKALSKRRKGI